MSVQSNFLDSMEMVAKDVISKAGYDKTIQAQIVSCEDATIGKYRCRYHGSIFDAYTNNPDTTFTKGSYVYVLVPGNNMDKEKTILGTTKKLGINYISQAQGDQAYNINGNNCISSKNTLYLDTFNKTYRYVVYQDGSPNEITLDIESLNQYIKQSSSIIAGATFKTSIPTQRQYRGHYGIIYNLRFLDNTSNQEVIRSYIINEDNMVNNPYQLTNKTRQYEIFDIDGENFIRVESIEIFNEDFPFAQGIITDQKLSAGDIEITDLQLYGATRMTPEQLSGVMISFYTPQGTFFTDSSLPDSYKTVTAQVKVKGKLVSAEQNIAFYWGIENVGISTNSEYYNKYLGRGWQCLNNSNIIANATVTQPAIVEWVPHSDTYILNFQNAISKNNILKVAIVYDGRIISNEINIQNLSSNALNITIQSNSGTEFYYDIGHPTLTCYVDGEEYQNYSYIWAYESSSGLTTGLDETTDQNNAFAQAVAELEALQADIAAGRKFANAAAEQLKAKIKAITDFEIIQRVSKNKIYDVQINRITSFGTFKCSVYDNNNKYLGTAAITLTNNLNDDKLYSLVINNGSAVYQYNENGVSPTSKSLDMPQEIQALSFTIYNSLGEAVEEAVVGNTQNCTVRWYFPIVNTMLVDNGDNGESAGENEIQGYRYYDNIPNLVYGILSRYNVRSQNNQIKLSVNYKGTVLTAETSFTFSKQGDPGTNGTQYLVKIIPNTRMTNPPLWPMITKVGNGYILNYGLNTTNDQSSLVADTGYQLFKAQLWHDGELVWQGSSAEVAALDGLTKPSSIDWSILKNKYNLTTSDDSAFSITDADNGYISYSGADVSSDTMHTPFANIIRCGIIWEKKIYYGTIPIITAWVLNSDYRVSLKEYTGFRHVVYTSDGINPQYDNTHPFEFICEERINDIWEDVSLVNGEHIVDYEIFSKGNYRSTYDGSAHDANLLQVLTNAIYRRNCQKNQWRVRPASRYDGVCVNAAVSCLYTQNNAVIVGGINIPIHFLLNKYGLANLNDWDGNSIQINEEGGFILSPQMGAGSKDNNNNFTGVLMGQVQTPGKMNPDIGLLGYADGDRTFFINSQNGAALFGKQGNGQIAIDPDADRALLYSNSFWENYKENGLPSSYNASNEAGEGLLIDLTKPEIRFGNGKFKVDNNGVYVRGNFVLQNGTPVEEIADDAIVSDTLHYLATSYGSGVTRENGAWGIWTTTPQNLTTINKYLWIYHTQVKGSGDIINTDPVINGVYGDPGPSGESALRIDIESDVGNIFLRTFTEATLTCHVWKGDEEVTSQVKQFNWIKKNRDGVVDADWSRPSQQSINIDSNDIKTKAIFVCEVEF